MVKFSQALHINQFTTGLMYHGQTISLRPYPYACDYQPTECASQHNIYICQLMTAGGDTPTDQLLPGVSFLQQGAVLQVSLQARGGHAMCRVDGTGHHVWALIHTHTQTHTIIDITLKDSHTLCGACNIGKVDIDRYRQKSQSIVRIHFNIYKSAT